MKADQEAIDLYESRIEKRDREIQKLRLELHDSIQRWNRLLREKESQLLEKDKAFNEKLKEIRNEVEVSSIDQYGISKVLEILDNHIKVNTKQG
jgi:NurA-like 5'-3' nuclease